jgi:hypothetical protein
LKRLLQWMPKVIRKDEDFIEGGGETEKVKTIALRF